MSTQLGEIGTGKCVRCGQCVHFNVYRPSKEINPENRDFGGWCAKNKVTTAPELLRCGGDDFERNNYL